MIKRSSTIKRISIAPMMSRTDRHFRYFMRQITQKTFLYTEMITTNALIYGNRKKHLEFSLEEKPLVLQLGGNNPKDLAECAKMAVDYGYDEINLNVGCPSNRVKNGCFGASLMKYPQIVAKAIEFMKNVVSIPITVKHRIGVDDNDSFEFMKNFVCIVSDSGCDRFIVHARIALLNGLSPKDNRNIPSLRYDDVYKLKDTFPHLFIEINGGIKSVDEFYHHLKYVDGVMIGRFAYENPFAFIDIDRDFYSIDEPTKSQYDIAMNMIEYIEKQLKNKIGLHSITKHMLNLFAHKRRSRYWRRYLSENNHTKNADSKIIIQALDQIKMNR